MTALKLFVSSPLLQNVNGSIVIKSNCDRMLLLRNQHFFPICQSNWIVVKASNFKLAVGAS